MALPKRHRLRRREDFNAVYRSGFRKGGNCLKLIVLPILGKERVSQLRTSVPAPGLSKPATQIGISISKRVSKRATVRNRIKRQIRAIIRQFLPDIAPGLFLVIVVRDHATECVYEDFLQELKQLLVKAEVFNGHSGRSLL